MGMANEIRDLYNSGYYTQKELGEMYGAHRKTISDLLNNKTWVSFDK